MILILCPCYPSTAIYGHHDGDWRGYSSTASYIYTSGIRNWMTSSCPHDLHISPHVQIIWPIRSLFLRRCPALSPVANACLNDVACMLPVFCPTNLAAAHCNVYTSLLRYQSRFPSSTDAYPVVFLLQASFRVMFPGQSSRTITNCPSSAFLRKWSPFDFSDDNKV